MRNIDDPQRARNEPRKTRLMSVAAAIILILVADTLCACSVPTATPTPLNLTVSDTNKSAYVDPRALAADPISYKGKNVFVQGQILNVAQHDTYTWAQIYAQISGDNSFNAESVGLRPYSSVKRQGG